MGLKPYVEQEMKDAGVNLKLKTLLLLLLKMI